MLESRRKIIDGYKEWAQDLFDRYRETYFVNFMFRALYNSTPRTLIDRMEKEIDRLYRLTVSDFERTPRRHPENLPMLMGMPDLPVFKRNKTANVPHPVNGGYHFNAMLFVPENCRTLPGQAIEIFQNAARKAPSLIERVHFTSVVDNPQKVVDYTFKLAKQNEEMGDHILILPSRG